MTFSAYRILAVSLTYLIDTNVLSDLRKQERCHPGVRRWFESVEDASLFTSVLVIGEIRRGIETVRLRDPIAANALQQWLKRLEDGFRSRILPIDAAIAERWGCLNAQRPLPVVDSLLAATALERGLVLVTRNVRDIGTTGVTWVNPFET